MSLAITIYLEGETQSGNCFSSIVLQNRFFNYYLIIAQCETDSFFHKAVIMNMLMFPKQISNTMRTKLQMYFNET